MRTEPAAGCNGLAACSKDSTRAGIRLAGLREGEFAFLLENDIAATTRLAERAGSIGTALAVPDIEYALAHRLAADLREDADVYEHRHPQTAEPLQQRVIGDPLGADRIILCLAGGPRGGLVTVLGPGVHAPQRFAARLPARP